MNFYRASAYSKNPLHDTSVSTHDEKHGRIEDRDYAVSDDVKWLHLRHPNWKTIRSIGFVDSRREEKGKVTCERRYFVSSQPAVAEEFAKVVRAHWGIENSLHYVLDVAFGEDGSRIRTDKGPENMSFIRKIALTIARSDTESKSPLPGESNKWLGLRNIWNNCFLLPALLLNYFSYASMR